MGTETQGKPSYEDLALRLSKMEEVFQNCQRLSVANQFAASVMHEVNNPLEAITNLVYLTKHEDDSKWARSYLDTVEEQLVVLADIARASLSFYRDQATMKEVDLVKVAESALKVHFARLSRGRLEICQKHSDNAICNGVASEILR
jgi:signal transduction histidine kinase